MDRSTLIKAGQAASEKWRAYARLRGERVERFLALCRKGLSREEIASKLGVSESHVCGFAQYHGLEAPALARPHRPGRRPKTELR